MFCYCATSRRIARTLTVRYDAALAPAGLTAAQFETLSVLASLETATGRTLVEKLAVDKTTLSRNLQSMIAAKLVLAKQDREDTRQQQYTLAADGKRKLSKAMPLWQAIHDETEALFTGSAKPSLQRMAAAL